VFEHTYRNRTVLITGHTGFKGTWLSLWLNHLGSNVIGYALKPPTQPSLFELCNLDTMVTSVEGDVRDFCYLKSVIQKYKPEIIFHLAAQALVRRSYSDPLETYSTNVMGIVHLLEAVRQIGGVKVIINVTSDKCYENQGWVWGYRENDPMGGHDPYSSSKGCAELITTAYTKSYFDPEHYERHGVSVASVRSGNVIGGGDWAEDRLLPDCMKALLENRSIVIRYPDAVRPWQHVLEPLFGYLLLAQLLYQNGAAFAGPWNFGPEDSSAKPVRWLVEKIVNIWGENAGWEIDPEDHPHEAHTLKLDCSKAKAKLGWYLQWGLETALRLTVDWYKAYRRHEDLLTMTIRQIQQYEEGIERKG
jgi:CDP-glucose 4,6-dehydratase